MRPGLTVFILFFGIALLDAVGGGHWARALFWVAMGGGVLAARSWQAAQAALAPVPR